MQLEKLQVLILTCMKKYYVSNKLEYYSKSSARVQLNIAFSHCI